MSAVIHALHILLAGIWLGGLVFTLAVVSPTFKQMGWSEDERIRVRSALGHQYTRVVRLNLIGLMILSTVDWILVAWRTLAFAELCCILLITVLSELHVRIYAPRLAQTARGTAPATWKRLLRVSIAISLFNLLASIILVILASLSHQPLSL